MQPNPYEASHEPYTPLGSKQSLPVWRPSRGYVLLEVFWIALAIVMAGYVALFSLLRPLGPANYYELALVLLAFFGEFFVIPTALGGLLGRIGMGAGAVCGFVLFMAVAQHAYFHGHF